MVGRLDEKCPAVKISLEKFLPLQNHHLLFLSSFFFFQADSRGLWFFYGFIIGIN